MSPLVVLILLCHLTYSIRANEITHINRHLLAGGRLPIQNNAQDVHTEETIKKEKEHVYVTSKKQNDGIQPKAHESKPPVESDKKSTVQPPAAKNETKIEEHQLKTTEMESGALLRGVSVIVALTTLVILYMALKTYCGRKGRNPVMVSKYGVRTRRSDIEMTPLPLEEDEDDETLFDVNSTNR